MKVGHSEPLVSQCRVERGMYALRYVEAAADPHPRAEIEFEMDQLRIVNAPGREGAFLGSPGETLILIAQKRCEFEIKVLAVNGGGTDAQFRLDLLDAGQVERNWVPEFGVVPETSPRTIMPRPSGREASDLTVIAHVSRRGDVRVGADDWVAGPNELLQIEGLAIATGRQELGVRIRVQTLHGGQQWSRWHEAGEFAGSRQRADPLTGIGVVLTGEDAPDFEISIDVMVLGSPSQTKTGSKVEISSPDPIVGFRSRLKPATAPVGSGVARSSAPVRVFRAKQ